MKTDPTDRADLPGQFFAFSVVWEHRFSVWDLPPVFPFRKPENYTKKTPQNVPIWHHQKGSKCGKNIWSKTGENPLKSRGLTSFSVEKTVENVKTFGVFSTVYGNGKGRFTPISTLTGENRCGKVDDLVENPQNGEFSPKIIHNVEFS